MNKNLSKEKQNTIKEVETWDDYSLSTMPMRIEDHLRLFAIMDDIDDESRLSEFKLLGQYLGLKDTYYICAVKDSNVMRLITNADGSVIKKLNKYGDSDFDITPVKEGKMHF
ncbi:hypothetical protein [Clostridium beijerinckii]|uniref:hypothetical protein n=1 Tax=Clostridium beijerinckii TaxID=1520 RepID=UPI0014945D03|nr:hypothetical protein [Clostridium beijerinckii]NOW07209.1 hypothetical protein [Clostridium beijerinckii]NYC05017.1 hypothetical protein [Clostridium beijerinckii]